MREQDVRHGQFRRPAEGPAWSGTTGWKSNGGAGKSHPDRTLPLAMEIVIPEVEGRLESVSLVGIFAMHASPEVEPIGTTGATVLLLEGSAVVCERDLVSGRHYGDATLGGTLYRLNGDGTSVDTVGSTNCDGHDYRVDALTLDVPGGARPDRLVFRDRGTPASFVLFDVKFAFEPEAVCPFKGHGGNVALKEVGSILRMRDRRLLDAALHQLSQGILTCGKDLDEARGLGLTFLGAVVAALLEMDASRKMHKVQLEFARELDLLDDPAQIASLTVRRVRELADPVVRRDSRTGDEQIDRALELVGRRFAEDLSVESLAKELHLSTSHFRHLFRETTRQPFNKYLVSLRLEMARELLMQTQTPVAEVAGAVGFRSTAHFSRAFSKRFGMPPSALRQNRR